MIIDYWMRSENVEFGLCIAKQFGNRCFSVQSPQEGHFFKPDVEKVSAKKSTKQLAGYSGMFRGSSAACFAGSKRTVTLSPPRLPMM